jgi:anti-sigma B factor antagonist
VSVPPFAGGPGDAGGASPIRVEPIDDGGWLVSLAGELDASNVVELNQAMAELVDAGDRPVVVDLRGADFIDSTMLGALVGWARHAREAGASLHYAVGDRTSAPVKLLEHTGAIGELDQVGAPADALRPPGGPPPSVS